MPDADSKPFTAALERFTPDAEPYANMTADRLEQVMADRLRAHDRTGYWEAELHLAEKTPPMERFIHDLGTVTNAWLHLLEQKGHLPYAGWTIRHGVAIWYMVHTLIRQAWTPETFPRLTPEESRKAAEDDGATFASQIHADPSQVEGVQAALEHDHGGPLVAPTPD
jgi:hypothetical protein